MARNERKRQQKLARRKKKRAAKRTGGAREFTRDAMLRREARLASTLPVLHCSIPSPEHFDDMGIGTVALARGSLSGEVTVAIFLIDIYCLGVKDAGLLRMPGHQFPEYIGSLDMNEDREVCEPDCARKLVLDSITYASNLGFTPHKDYRQATLLFGDVDAASCNREFVFGYNGKPKYISGPHDDPAMIQRVITTLERTCGSGNYEVVLGMSVAGDDFF